MRGLLRSEQPGTVLAGVKATPCGWPAASLDPGCGRSPTTTDEARREKSKDKIHSSRVSTVRGDCRAQALLAAFRTRLGAGYATATPDTLQRRFLDSSGTITTTGDQVTVRIDRRAYSPVLRQASLPPDTTIPWWHGQRLHFEFS